MNNSIRDSKRNASLALSPSKCQGIRCLLAYHINCDNRKDDMLGNMQTEVKQDRGHGDEQVVGVEDENMHIENVLDGNGMLDVDGVVNGLMEVKRTQRSGMEGFE